MPISRRLPHVVITRSRRLSRSLLSKGALRSWLKAAAMSIAMLSGSALADFCESDIALIDSNFSGGNLGVCEFTTPTSVSFTITPEDAPPINPSAWYSFRLSPKKNEAPSTQPNFCRWPCALLAKGKHRWHNVAAS